MPPVTRRTIVVYADENGREPFTEWYKSIKDRRIKDRIDSRLDRIRDGNFGDHRSISRGNGIQELRFRIGPGYRVYYAAEGRSVVILLGAGDKQTQKKDIQHAVTHWLNYLDQKDHE